MTFRVGDRVEVINDELYDFANVGDQGVVTEIDNDGDLWVLYDGQETTWCGMPSRFRVAPLDVPPSLDSESIERWLDA